MEYEIKTIQIIPLHLIEIGDEGRFIAEIESSGNAAFLLSQFNKIQQKILTMKMAGYKIKEIAEYLNTNSQAINYQNRKIKQQIKIAIPFLGIWRANC